MTTFLQDGPGSVPTSDGAPALKAVLFDRDDTLSHNDREVYGEAAKWVEARYGLDPRMTANHMLAQWASVMGRWEHLRTLDDEARFWEGFADGLAARLGLPSEAGRAIVHAWPYERYLVPARGARDLLLELRARGLRVGVLSNTLPNIDATLDAIGIGDLVDVAVASCTLGVHKPDPRAFLLTADLLGVRPNEVLFVDDRLDNVEAARALGMRALLIDHAGLVGEAVHDLAAVLAHLPRPA